MLTHHALTPAQKIPVIAITGYLGSGKTTLLNRLLGDASGKKIAILVNDFGVLNVDAELLNAAVDGIIALQDGCICCSMADGLHASIFKVLQQDEQPDLILIEPSGVANAGELRQVLSDETLREVISLELVVMMLDCSRFDDYTEQEKSIVVPQLKFSDTVILTKTDLVPSLVQNKIREKVVELAQGTLILSGLSDQITLDLFCGTEVKKNHAGYRKTFIADTGNPQQVAEKTFKSWVYESKDPLSQEDVKRLIQSLPASTVRGKGSLYLSDYPDEQFVFQMVGKRAHIEPGGPWRPGAMENKIVFIALREREASVR